MLEDGRSVLTQASFLRALGRHPKANVRREGGEERVPAILQGKALQPFISDEIREKSRPIASAAQDDFRMTRYLARPARTHSLAKGDAGRRAPLEVSSLTRANTCAFLRT